MFLQGMGVFMIKLLILNLFCGLAISQGVYEEANDNNDNNNRQERLFDLKDIQSGFEEVLDNVQQSLGTLSHDLGNLFNNRKDNRYRHEAPLDIDAIEGPLGGVDDGLRVFYPSYPPLSWSPSGNQNPFTFSSNGDRVGYPHQDIPGSSSIGRPFRNPFRNIFGGDFFNIGQRTPWWKGENVCVEREEVQESEASEDVVNLPKVIQSPNFSSSFELSSCSEDGRKYTCVTETKRNGVHKTLRTSYQCCHGYMKKDTGCTKVDMRPLMETLENLPMAANFVSLMKSTGVENLVLSSNVTVFVPTNEALEDFTADLIEKNEIPLKPSFSDEKSNSDLNFKEIVLSHFTKGFMFAGDFNDEEVIPSLNNDALTRINTYGGYPKMVTANCAPIVQSNVPSINGVVHMVGQVLPSATSTLAQIIDKDPQFSILKQMLADSDLNTSLRQPGQFTLLAPTDAAFERINVTSKQSLSNGPMCVNDVLENHVLPNTICSSAMLGRMRTINNVGDYLIVKRNEDDKLFVQDSQIVAKDIVATNGVLHILDKVLVPDHAKPMREVLNYHNLTTFIELLEKSDLLDELEASGNRVSIFAPRNEAFLDYPEKEMTLLRNDKQKLRELLKHHMVSETTPESVLFQNNQVTRSNAGLGLRFNTYSTGPNIGNLLNLQSTPPKFTVGCSRISLTNSRACGGVVHILEEVLTLPNGKVIDELNDEMFSYFREMIQKTNYTEKLNEEGPFTLFAPSDYALNSLPENELKQILESTELMEKIVEKHILPEQVCCSGINPNRWPFTYSKRTMGGSTLNVRRTPQNHLMAGHARIVKCGQAAENGVVHTLDGLAFSHRELAMLLEGGGDSNSFSRRTPIFPFF